MPWLDIEIFRSLLKQGKIELYLDALDEVSYNIRSTVNSNITEIIHQYSKTIVILTTRYGDRYVTPAFIKEYHVRPFSLHQAVDLIYALNFDEEPKLRFAQALKEGLFDKNSDLLSNPLLCSIMLLTYRRFATIPDRLHLYYQQAYEVLFSRHDAGKERGFKRELTSDLDVSQMQSVLNYLAAVSYASEKFEFSESECVEMITEAVQSTGVGARPSEIKDDLIEAVSMLHPDGLYLKFVHRSFQEFFCAHYISKAKNSVARACIDAVKMRQDTDAVIPMAIALNSDRFEEAWLNPTIEADHQNLSNLSDQNRYYEIVRDYLPYISIHKTEVFFRSESSSKSRNFSIYLSTLDQPGHDFFFKSDRLGSLVGQKYVADAPSYLRAHSLNIVLSKPYRELLKLDEIKIDLEDRNWSGLSDLDIWKPVAMEILKSVRLWRAQIAESAKLKESSPLDAFQRAAAAGSRRLEGNLAGGRRRNRNEDATE